jgi:DNA-directed RNA polymerase I subunit RPA1
MEKDDRVKTGMNLKSKSKLKASLWGPLGEGEAEVIVSNNELLQGILDKSQLGDSEYGLTHAFYEIYGASKTGDFLTSMARCLTAFL